MRIFGLSILLAGALLASDYSYEISPMIGGVKPEGNLDIDDQFTYGVRFQINDYNLLGFVPELSFDRTTDTDYDPNVGDTAINRFGFNGLYDFKNFSDKVTPYFLLGLGYEDVEDEKNSYDSSMYGNYGGGVKFKIFKDIALRAEVKHLIRTDDGGNELYYGLGLSIPFGEKAQATAEEKPQEPAPVAVEKDSDNDGIQDSRDNCPNTPAGVEVNTSGCGFDSDNDGVKDYQDKCPTTPAGRVVNSDGCELDSDNDGVVDGLDKCPNTKSGLQVDKNGCPNSIDVKINFETASAKINNEDSVELKTFAAFMHDNPAYDVEIVGHTDNQGAKAFNQKLSEQRAESVKKTLLKHGIEESRIKTSGKGEDEPVASNDTEEGRAHNRRIEEKLKLND